MTIDGKGLFVFTFVRARSREFSEDRDVVFSADWPMYAEKESRDEAEAKDEPGVEATQNREDAGIGKGAVFSKHVHVFPVAVAGKAVILVGGFNLLR